MAEIAKTRRQLTPTPELSPVTGAQETQEAFGRTIQGLGENTRKVLERKRRLDTIDNNTWLLNTTNDYQRRARELYVPMFSRTGEDAKGSMTESKQFFKTIRDEIAKNAPDDESANRALEKISQLHNSYENKLIINETKQVELGNIEAIGIAADEQAEDVFTNGGTAEAIEQGIANMELTITEAGAELGSEKVKELKQATSQHIANTAINRRMRVDPEGTAADLDAGKYSKWITQEDRENHLKNARSEAKWQKDQAREAEVEAQDDALAAVIKEPTPAAVQGLKGLYPDDAKWQATLSGMESNMVKAGNQATIDDQYRETSNWMRLSDNPAAITNQEIINRVGDSKDGEHFMQQRDRYKKAKLNNVDYKNMLNNLDLDFDADKFGDKDSKEGREEYTSQLRVFERYMIENPEADAREYYNNLMDPINAKHFDNFSWGADTDIKPKDFAIARQIEETKLDTQAAERLKQTTKSAWVRRAREANPGYTDAELSNYYDTNIKGTQ